MKGEKYLRQERIPTIWCPGCGNGIVLHGVLSVMEDLNYKQEDVVFVSGIGCSSRSSTYTIFDNIHTLHGRAIPIATAIKMVQPGKKVIVMTGDGDSMAIGGNHIIHAARRNMDITVIIFNNSIYGMTGGQFSPLTPNGKKATTSHLGNIEETFDSMKLLEGAGATYLARIGTYHYIQMMKYMKAAFLHSGFSAVEVVTQCPIYYGRLNQMPTPYHMMMAQKDTMVFKTQAEKMDEHELIGKIQIGEFVNITKPSYLEKKQAQLERMMQR
jgi:2-oxoglutarate ferredoxin oxidoreductase subunit beta